jgi:hypothetical protein
MTEISAAPQSLLIISLPRSMSTITHRIAVQVLGLQAPVWTSAGEILNNDRFVMHGCRTEYGLKFTDPETQPDLAQRLFAFLDQTIRTTGFAYKDVVQPLVISKWLTMENRGLAVLRIRRNLVDVGYSMLKNGWLYPAERFSLETGADLEKAFLLGLLHAEAALDAVPAVEVCYNDLIRDESALLAALQTLAPHRGITGLTYIDAKFRQASEERLRIRETERYRLLQARLEEVRQSVWLKPYEPATPATSG